MSDEKEREERAMDIRLQLVAAYLQGAGGVVPPAHEVMAWISRMEDFVLGIS